MVGEGGSHQNSRTLHLMGLFMLFSLVTSKKVSFWLTKEIYLQNRYNQDFVNCMDGT